MRYPEVLSEEMTLYYAAHGKSIARFGDGELNIACGGSSVSQKADPNLRAELLAILARQQGRTDDPRLLVCIPNLASACPRHTFWEPFTQPGVVTLYGRQQYGSSFISRPDNAPWIDKPQYWDMVRSIWNGMDVCIVEGNWGLSPIVRRDCRTSNIIAASERDAYAEIDAMERAVLYWVGSDNHRGPVLISLGAAGTALAARLARKGIWALDLGHMGNFMDPKNVGAFAFESAQLATDDYRKLLRHAHETTNWGRGGASWAEQVAAFARKLEANSVLDYGCGGGTLKPALKAYGVPCTEYDPGIPGKDIPPKLADVVVSTDVFEHIEPELVPNVLAHVYRLARKGAFLVIAKQPAKKILADGRNAHLTCRETAWWIEALIDAGWYGGDIKVVTDEWKKVVLKLRK